MKPLHGKSGKFIYSGGTDKENIKRIGRESQRKLRKEHPEYFRNQTHKYRMKIIEMLGGHCVRCGEDDWRCLQTDHIDGGGNKDFHNGGNARYCRIIREIKENPNKFQLLCANCNWRKRYENKEGYRGI